MYEHKGFVRLIKVGARAILWSGPEYWNEERWKTGTSKPVYYSKRGLVLHSEAQQEKETGQAGVFSIRLLYAGTERIMRIPLLSTIWCAYIYLDDGEDIYLFGNRSFQFSNVLSFVQLRQILFLRSNFRNKEIAAYSCAINLRFCQILGLVPKISNSAK